MNNIKILKIGYTLAEVLITLGIIGVVASIIISTLVDNYQKKITGSKLKQAYSILTNALKMAETEYGGGVFPLREQIYTVQLQGDKFKMFETYFVPYLRDVHKVNTNKRYYGSSGVGAVYNNVNNGYCINNGMCFAFLNYENIYSYILVDLDGPNHGKNKVGRDVFVFAIHFNNDKTIIDGKTYDIDSYGTIDRIYKYKCNKEIRSWDDGSGCTEIIMRNNWEIPDDKRYPW